MADDTQLTRASHPVASTTPPPGRPAPAADDPEAARAEIEATRARMSETIDEIEGALLRKKEKIRDQLDVLAPVREQPIKTLGMIFGGALLLGLLTGGGRGRGADGHDHDDDDDDDEISLARARYEEPDEDEEDEDEAELAWERAEEWEDRAHRLLRIARAQETELEIHRERHELLRRQLRARRAHEDDDEEYDEEGEPNLFERLRESAAERIAALAGEVSDRMMRGG